MSKWDCVKCGHDTEGEGGNPWFGEGGSRICKKCCETLARKFYALFMPKSGAEWDEYGPTVPWHEVVKILDAPHERDAALRVTHYHFVLTELAERLLGVAS